MVPALGPRDEHDSGGRDRQDHLCERSEAIAHHRVREQRLGDRSLGEHDAGEDRGEYAPEQRHSRCDSAPHPLGHEDGREERDAGRAEQRERRRERQPVDVRRVDHGGAPEPANAVYCVVERAVAHERRAGGEHEQGEHEREQEPELTGSQIERLLPHGGPCPRWRIAEISRRVYIAASTIPSATTAV